MKMFVSANLIDVNIATSCLNLKTALKHASMFFSPIRSVSMLSRRPRKCQCAIPVHTISLQALSNRSDGSSIVIVFSTNPYDFKDVSFHILYLFSVYIIIIIISFLGTWRIYTHKTHKNIHQNTQETLESCKYRLYSMVQTVLLNMMTISMILFVV